MRGQRGWKRSYLVPCVWDLEICPTHPPTPSGGQGYLNIQTRGYSCEERGCCGFFFEWFAESVRMLPLRRLQRCKRNPGSNRPCMGCTLAQHQCSGWAPCAHTAAVLLFPSKLSPPLILSTPECHMTPAAASNPHNLGGGQLPQRPAPALAAPRVKRMELNCEV